MPCYVKGFQGIVLMDAFSYYTSSNIHIPINGFLAIDMTEVHWGRNVCNLEVCPVALKMLFAVTVLLHLSCCTVWSCVRIIQWDNFDFLSNS